MNYEPIKPVNPHTIWKSRISSNKMYLD
jgi:hypothetical protein